MLLAKSGSGLVTSGPTFQAPATGDQIVQYVVRESAVYSGGGVDLRVRDALDLRNATGIRVKVGATTDTGKPITLTITARRELGTSAVLGTITVPSGTYVTKTLPVPSGAKNFRNVIGVAVSRSALQSLSPTLNGRRVAVKVADVAVMV